MAIPESSSTDTASTVNQSGMDVTFLETASFWSNISVVAFGILGVAAAVFALYFSARLGATKDAELARFQVESRVAISASDARAAEANEKAAAALANAAEANKTAESFRLDIAKANERAASASEIAERERLARLRLEARLADRILTPAQQESISAALKPLGVFSAQIFTYSSITEVLRIGDNIASIAIAAGWTVASATASGGVTVTGIILAVGRNASPDVRTAMVRLVEELARNGVSAQLSNTPMEEIPGPGISFGSMLPSPQVRILIGTK